MPIRIRVYPQPNSIGARRNRMRRQQQRMHQAQLRYQRAWLQQQMLGFNGPRGIGFGGYQHGFGVSSYCPPTAGYSGSLLGAMSYSGGWGWSQPGWASPYQSGSYGWGGAGGWF